jgi:hypothetical protein
MPSSKIEKRAGAMMGMPCKSRPLSGRRSTESRMVEFSARRHSAWWRSSSIWSSFFLREAAALARFRSFLEQQQVS